MTNKKFESFRKINCKIWIVKAYLTMNERTNVDINTYRNYKNLKKRKRQNIQTLKRVVKQFLVVYYLFFPAYTHSNRSAWTLKRKIGWKNTTLCTTHVTPTVTLSGSASTTKTPSSKRYIRCCYAWVHLYFRSLF